MKMHRMKTFALAAAVSAGALTLAAGVHAATVNDVLQVGQAKAQDGQQSQTRVDKLANEANDLLTDFRTVNKQLDGLNVYNQRLEKQIENQMRRVRDYEQSIEDVTVIQRQITPLVIRMIDGLEKFVELDVPFHLNERRERITLLRRNLDRSDVTVAEKFRQVLEAYKIETEYGRRLDTYQGIIAIEGAEREVSFLRIGRVALVYQTPDMERMGAWNPRTRQWEELSSGAYRSAVQKGLRIARNQQSIDILDIPVPAPEAAQ